MILYRCIKLGEGMRLNMGFIVAIDGPAGSGKGTVTKLVVEM